MGKKSILTEYTEACAICGRPRDATHHLIPGRGLRKLADEDGLTIPLCNECHNMGGGSHQIHENPVAEALSKMLGQVAWEKEFYKGEREDDPAHEAFRKRYGKSFL